MSSDTHNNDLDNNSSLENAEEYVRDALTDSDINDNDFTDDSLDSLDESLDSVTEPVDDNTQNADVPPLKANKKVKTAKRGGGFFSALTFLLALGALAISAYTYWLQNNFTKTADSSLTDVQEVSDNLKNEMQVKLKEVANSIEGFSDGNDELVNELNRNNKRVERNLKVDIDSLGDRLDEVDTQIVSLKGYSAEAKYAYVKAELEYFLQMANNRIDLAQDAGTALAALEAADDRLKLLNDPSLKGVRAQMLDEIQQLKAIEQPDIQKLALTLASIAKQVPSLPLRMDDEKDYYTEEIKLKEGTGFRVGMSNVWRSMKGTLDKLVEVRDATPSDVPLMSVEDLGLLYINLDVQLQSARLASLKADASNYQVSIQGAKELLTVYFDTEKPQVKAIINSLAEIENANLSPELPDISQSLILLRQKISGKSNESSNE